MRNALLARALVALGLTVFVPGGAEAQRSAGHAHGPLGDDIHVHQGDLLWFRGEREIGSREVIEGDVVVASGSLTVRGEVHGDAVVGDGDLVLEAGAVVFGDAVVTGGRLVNHGGQVLGTIQEGGPSRRAGGTQTSIHINKPLIGALGAGWTGVAATLVLGLVLFALGGAVSVYGRAYLEQASDVVRRSPLNAATVGLAANVLALPAFLVGMAALILTLVGIPFLLVFIPLFWTAVIVLAATGAVAVAHAVGRRAGRGREGALGHLMTGVPVLLAPVVISHLLGVTPLSGAAAAVLTAVSWTLLWLAASVGAGAVMIVGVRAWHEHGYRKSGALGGMDDLGTGVPRS